MKYLFLYGGAIGDTLLGIHLGRTLAQHEPGSSLVMISTRRQQFARELTQEVPFIAYREMQSKNPLSWLYLPYFALSTWKSAVFVPFVNPLSTWWKILLWCVRRSGGTQIWCHINELPVPQGVEALRYSSKTDNLFDVAASIVGRWGISTPVSIQPSLTPPTDCAPTKAPYIVFHFFAGAYRRSVPVEHARPILQEARALYTDYSFFVTCSSAEEESAKRMTQGIANTHVVVTPSAHELMCLLSNARGCVGAASGVTHIAAHLHVPSVVMCNLSDPCWLPTYNPEVVLLAERSNCGCNGDKTGECGAVTPEGVVYRCLYDITTESVIKSMQRVIPPFI